ncbi:MAG: valine--tRNA ligase [Bacteroidales bacterium]|nr:valine--tRNA ligase [Bacteroidales bacterium]MCF8389949.1 valine--tRNA ligase [Bacteroidales bacterium]
MDIPSKYNPSETEDKWYEYWQKHKFFESDPDEREPYTIVIPPPNVTGVLHMGHMLNNTIQDVLVRRARMMGKNALWVPGTDHASIATEAKVVGMLKERGINKSELSREQFLEYAWEWKEKHGGIILEQLKKLGASCDWRRTAFTMDDSLSESVLKVFIDLYNKGLVYRGVRMVNWDPQAKTALSDEEVIHKELQSKLYYVKYKVEGEDNHIVIATTRPETILGDTAVCVNPQDERFKTFHGKNIIIPLVNRVVPLIQDEYVDMEFGTGALKITPAHDENDYKIGLKYNLPGIDIFNDDGSLNERAELYVGEDRFVVRKKIVKDLEEKGHILKIEDYINKVGFSERTDAVIEPKLSLQWFLNMKELAKPALENVMNDSIKLFPPKFKNTYRHWMENVNDWCISRQLWWGQRIPAYYYGENPGPNDYVVAYTIEDALLLAKEKSGNKDLTADLLKQDEDVLDTWFSSWLWPISVFDGIRNPDNKDMKYYYPTNDLVTAPEILFFWVARMIMAGYEYQAEKPFKNVYLTGIVRDAKGRKMSKSLGNSPDPIELMKKYSADGVRVGMLLCSPAGNDLLFDELLTEQGRNFSNKIWNVFRLIKSMNVDEDMEQNPETKIALEWFENKLNAAIIEMDEQYGRYRLSDALMSIYRLFWEEASSWFLEIIKPGFEKSISKKSYDAILVNIEKLLALLHPFMPFITEEIWHYLKDRKDGESLMISPMPLAGKVDEIMIEEFERVKQIITTVRNIRNEKQIPMKETLTLHYKINEGEFFEKYVPVILKLANVSELTEVEENPEGGVSFIVKNIEYYLPIGDKIDTEAELKRLEAELEYTIGFLDSVKKKLANERFVSGAPEAVVLKEKEKLADAESKIASLKIQIISIK